MINDTRDLDAVLAQIIADGLAKFIEDYDKCEDKGILTKSQKKNIARVQYLFNQYANGFEDNYDTTKDVSNEKKLTAEMLTKFKKIFPILWY